MSRPRRVLVFSGSRGEYGYIRPVMRELVRREDTTLSVVVAEMHAAAGFGETQREFVRDGFRVDHRIDNAGPDRTPASSVADLGVLMQRIAGVLSRDRPDIALLSGDRREQLVVGIAAASLSIPVAHIQGGELSGHFDGMFRHAITRVASMHFVANERCAARVKALGEHAFRIHVVGAPQLDEIAERRFDDPDAVLPRYGLDSEQYLVLLLHPCAQDDAPGGEVAANLRAAVDAWLDVSPGRRAVWVAANNDPEHHAIRAVIDSLDDRYVVAPSLPRGEFLAILARSLGIVGNSSCGVLEAPSLGIGALNIGRRQHNREHADSLVAVGVSEAAIRDGLARLGSMPRRLTDNPYFRPRAAARIVDVLASVPIDAALITKQYEDPLDA